MNPAVEELDVRDPARLEELLWFGREAGSSRHRTAGDWLAAAAEADHWTCRVARRPAGIVGVAEALVHPAFGPTAPQLNALVADHDAAALEALVDSCAAWEPATAAVELVAHVTDPDARTLNMWVSLGFEQRGSRTRYRLGLDAAPPPAAAQPPAGVRIVALAERPDLEPAADELWRTTHADIPSELPFDPSELSIRADLRIAADAPMSPAVFCALAAVDEPVGILCLVVRDGWAGHRMTGVAADWRGRGVARALKLHAIGWAQAAGLAELQASNDDANDAMRRLNESIGYRPIRRLFLLRRPVRREGGST